MSSDSLYLMFALWVGTRKEAAVEEESRAQWAHQNEEIQADNTAESLAEAYDPNGEATPEGEPQGDEQSTDGENE